MKTMVPTAIWGGDSAAPRGLFYETTFVSQNARLLFAGLPSARFGAKHHPVASEVHTVPEPRGGVRSLSTGSSEHHIDTSPVRRVGPIDR